MCASQLLSEIACAIYYTILITCYFNRKNILKIIRCSPSTLLKINNNI